ncbi:hypothetical protein Ade02nite_20690 [Paractinoplanes deccanensis]|uniref:Excalibur calcium-binding domain-containing protein n=1 Tax=Paractinoplanes deccanensis TaxID=113561 RepID=A0ABQ3Y0B8_9ACTN|nr:excalibur calcium-binding domain-containing protein [Actinoplanes deccanensis]GID73428.1 hypothetical protein Ade02nite_20690 [Actinoplanes deccanensis]
MTKDAQAGKPKATTGSTIFAILVLVSFLCCGGVVINAFTSDDDPSPTTTPRAGDARPTATATAASAVPNALDELASPTANEVQRQASPTRTSASPKPTTQRPKPRPTTTKSKPRKTTKAPTSVYYKNCSAVRAAGADPIYRGDPGYGRHLDRDGDGVACE